MPRVVTLVVVDPAGRPLGELPPFEVASPWWPEVGEVVAGARERFGVAVTVLRLLDTTTTPPRGGAGRYLVEADDLPRRFHRELALAEPDDPRRAPYARPGGPAATLRWAAEALERPITAAVQTRTWNLSAVWRLATPTGPVWLKQVPTFFAHEPTVISWVGAAVAPRLLAADGGRMLLEHLAGADRWGAPAPVRVAIARRWHPTQAASAAGVEELIAAGVPDLRAGPLLDQARDVVRRHGGVDPRLSRLVDTLPERLAAIAACGVSETLIHGDLHPGNVLGETMIDWGDSAIAHPGFDVLRLAEGLPDDTPLLDAWAALWPAAEARRALELLRPVHALRNAAAYAAMLDQIEPSEQPYHVGDVPLWLGDAIARTGDPAQRS